MTFLTDDKIYNDILNQDISKKPTDEKKAVKNKIEKPKSAAEAKYLETQKTKRLLLAKKREQIKKKLQDDLTPIIIKYSTELLASLRKEHVIVLKLPSTNQSYRFIFKLKTYK